jgi:tryptophan-rich sensory protein
LSEPDFGIRWPRLLGAIIVCLGVGGIGSIATSDGTKTWYPTLEKPPFNPPSVVFGPVWTTLYVLMGIAEYLVWKEGRERPEIQREVKRAQKLFAIQLGLNLGWSFLFFKLQSPLIALIELILLWLAILATIRAFARLSRPATLLLLPYLAWTTFAGVLNASIWWLNR